MALFSYLTREALVSEEALKVAQKSFFHFSYPIAFCSLAGYALAFSGKMLQN
jgi:hypothetical protein